MEPSEPKLKASDASDLVDLVFHGVESRDVTDELRSSLAKRHGSSGEKIKAHWGSLQRDPRQASAYYLAIDSPRPTLLHMSLATSPEAVLFPNATSIGRVRPGGGREVLVNAIPFASVDYENIDLFTALVDPAFLPSPQRARSGIGVGTPHPEISLPAVFDAFRTIHHTSRETLGLTVLFSTAREMAVAGSIEQRDGEDPTEAGPTRVSIQHLYHAAIWGAVRSGWRQGYSLEADHITIAGADGALVAASVEAAKEVIREATGFTKFTTDTSRLFELHADTRHPQFWNDSQVEQALGHLLSPSVTSWALEEFSRKFDTGEKIYQFTKPEVRRLLLKFGRSLTLNEELYDFIKQAKAASSTPGDFDFEPALDEAQTLTTPREMLFYLHWLSSRGRHAQCISPNLGFKRRRPYPETLEALTTYAQKDMWPELRQAVAAHNNSPLLELASRVTELASVARYSHGTLSIHSGSGKQQEVLKQVGQATGRRFTYQVSGELQLQLFDVISEQPEESRWRQLYNRMVARCLALAAQNAFAAEHDLATIGPGSFLGSTRKGRSDGNLFLVLWLGSVVGSRDLFSTDGDKRFFKEKLDELPEDLMQEVRMRNRNYLVGLARHLQS